LNERDREAFVKIAEGVDVAPALAELACLPEHCWLRINPDESVFVQLLAGENERQFQRELPETWRLIDHLLAILAGAHGDRGRLIHARVGRMPPGWGLPPHFDGVDGIVRRRYQLALRSEPGVVLTVDGEAKFPRPGDAWQIDASRVHSIHNGSAVDRIAIVFDTGP
jgi:aspartyl/asparaginyl beta-hydroxylase (cupin superfamily)